MASSRLLRLHEAGQSVWLDYIDRTILRNGELQRMIREDHITGMTSNPTIFEKALSEGTAYDVQISTILDMEPAGLFEELETDDVRAACDIFRDCYEASSGEDGYVSIEVSPNVAHDTDATVQEARRLWEKVDRPNVMVKVPGTGSGAEALETLIAEGVNVNVTLLFSVPAYERVAEGYLRGLERRVAAELPIDGVASVASFFISRIDSEVDARLAALVAAGVLRESDASSLRGQAAVANARNAYQSFKTIFSGPRWEALYNLGARVQRPLWASTSTKNPAYRDVMYVEELIGPHTVNTMPPATLAAFRDHGNVERTVDRGGAEYQEILLRLAESGISLSDVTDKLLAEGIAAFQRSFDSLLQGLEGKVNHLLAQLTSH